MGVPQTVAHAARTLLQCQLLVALALPPVATGSWMTNDGTAASSIVVGHSGVAQGGEDRKPFMAVDGNLLTDWDSATDPADQSCWLALDFGETVTIDAFALTGRGDEVHDTKDHELQSGPSPKGPWATAGSFVAKPCKPPDFAAADCAQPNSGALKVAKFRQVFTLPSSASGRYFRWVAKTRYSEYQVYLQEIEFRLAPAWGWAFLIVLMIGSGGYLGGFAAYNYKTKGLRGRELLPHQEFWREMLALVEDGWQFSKARLDEYRNGNGNGAAGKGAAAAAGAAGGYESVPDADAGAVPAAGAGAGAGGDDNDSDSGDDLVE